MQFLGMRMAGRVEPEFVIEPESVNHQGVSLILADRFAKPGGIRVRGMFTPIHEDLAIAVDVRLEQEIDVLGSLNNAPRKWSQPGYAGGEAISLRIVLRHALLCRVQSRALHRELLAILEGFSNVAQGMAVRAPYSREAA